MNKQEALSRLSAIEQETAELRKIINQPDKPLSMSKEKRFFELLDGCTIKINKETFPDSIFFMKNDKYMFEIEKQYFFTSYERVWSIFKKEFNMNYKDIEGFIEAQVEEHFKMNGLIPAIIGDGTSAWVEEHFKMNGLTPNHNDSNN